LNPEPFFDTNTKQIAKATGIPKSILEGAEAGALTGSEKNDQQYYKKISGIQSDLEDVNRWVIDQTRTVHEANGLNQADAVKDRSLGSVRSRLLRMIHKVAPQIASVKDQSETKLAYEILWNNAFEQTAVDKARTELINEQANQTRLQYKTVDEVRTDNNLDPLPLGEGEVVLSLRQPSNPFQNAQSNPTGVTGSNPQGKLGVDYQDAAVPSMRELIKPVVKQVFNGHLSHELALQQGLALIEFYHNHEKERALEYIRGKFQNPNITLSPEQEKEFASQKERFQGDFAAILAEAEKIAKSKVSS
jgi:hypothetical protein